MRASSRKAMINGGGRGLRGTPSYAPGLLCRLRGLSPGARPGGNHRRPARPGTLGRIAARPRVMPCAPGCDADNLQNLLDKFRTSQTD